MEWCSYVSPLFGDDVLDDSDGSISSQYFPILPILELIVDKLYKLRGPSSVCQSASCTHLLRTLLHPAPSSANISRFFDSGGKIPLGPFSEARKAYHLRSRISGTRTKTHGDPKGGLYSVIAPLSIVNSPSTLSFIRM